MLILRRTVVTIGYQRFYPKISVDGRETVVMQLCTERDVTDCVPELSFLMEVKDVSRCGEAECSYVKQNRGHGKWSHSCCVLLRIASAHLGGAKKLIDVHIEYRRYKMCGIVATRLRITPHYLSMRQSISHREACLLWFVRARYPPAMEQRSGKPSQPLYTPQC